MRRAFFLFGVVALLGLPGPVEAANLPGGTVTISSVTLEGDRVFIAGPGFTNPEGCESRDVIVLAVTPEMRDRYLSVATTALASGLRVDLWVQGCSATNWGTAAVAYLVRLHR